METKQLPGITPKMLETLQVEAHLQQTTLSTVLISLDNIPEVVRELVGAWNYINSMVGHMNMLSDQTVSVLPEILQHQLSQLESLRDPLQSIHRSLEQLHHSYQRVKGDL